MKAGGATTVCLMLVGGREHESCEWWMTRDDAVDVGGPSLWISTRSLFWRRLDDATSFVHFVAAEACLLSSYSLVNSIALIKTARSNILPRHKLSRKHSYSLNNPARDPSISPRSVEVSNRRQGLKSLNEKYCQPFTSLATDHGPVKGCHSSLL